VEPQIGISSIGRRQVQVSGHAQLAADPHRANRIFLLIRDGQTRAIGGARRSQPRSRKAEAERNPGQPDRGDRIPPRRLTHAVKLLSTA
jgi:hypothetical protein